MISHFINSNFDSHDSDSQRQKKLAELKIQGNPYPNSFKQNACIHDIVKSYTGHSRAMLEENPVSVSIAGRVKAHRIMSSKVHFLDLQNLSGKLQTYLHIPGLSSEVQSILEKLDVGDIVGVSGILFRTKTGELSVKASDLCILTKSLHPLPDKFHGLKDTDMRYRQRYLDLIANVKTREIFIKRTQLLKTIRQFFDNQNYFEVETPMMQTLAGGALAKPFITHHNALNQPLFLRVAPELYLKRLIVGGYEKVYEMNRNFRNEGLSTRHNPEFTMLEFYEAYATYEDAMNLIESLIKNIAQNLLDSFTLDYQGKSYDLSQPFARLTLKASLLRYNSSLNLEILEDFDKLQRWATSCSLDVNAHSLGTLQFAVFEETVEKQLMAPTFITQHPIEVSPLARRNEKNPELADRFEFYMAGRELANGFSELNDPKDQSDRFKAQVSAQERGDQEAMSYDQDYITALEYGLPPTAGAGIGIDRLMMLLTDTSAIRDVILFPTLRRIED